MTFFRTTTMSHAYDTVYESRLPIIDGLLYPEIYLYVNKIRYGLEQKLEAMVRHEWYAKYKTAPTPEEREAARQRYLDERGVPQSFRWQTSPWES